MTVEQTSLPMKRGCLFYLKRGVKWISLFLVALILLGVGYQAIATEFDRRNFSPSGQLLEVDGHRMHIHCTGSGSPTVILEAGAYSFSAEWYWVQGQLESHNRVCSYDRAGNGWSDSVDGNRDGLTLVHELHRLLQEAHVEPPYIMVGHSLGGVLAPIYVSQYPDEVLGLVLVDSAVPRQLADYAEFEQDLYQFPNPYTLMIGLTHTGVIRLILLSEFQSYGYPAHIAGELTAFKATLQGVNTWNAEARLAKWELGQQLYSLPNLGNLPVVVLWASNPGFVTPEERLVLAQIWAMLPTFSDNSVVRVVEGANHGSIVGNEQYAQQVTNAVFEVIHAARTQTPLMQ